MSAKSFTERQGQYLAFIDAYTRVHGRPPAETDAAPFPAQPAFRAPDGPHAGAPRPHPPPARRRPQHRGAPRPPRLARSASPPTGQILCAEELGWQPGRNMSLEFRWYGGEPNRAKALAKELLALSPDILVANSTIGLDAVIAV